MPQIEETPLPGVGLRFEFSTREGVRLGVVHHRTGRREVFLARPEDPDSAFTVALTEQESQALAELLGGSQVITHLHDLQQRIEGLAIDWLSLSGDSPYAGRQLGDARIRTRTGVSVVAILRGESAIPAPGPEDGLRASDTLVVVGRPEGIEAVEELLQAG